MNYWVLILTLLIFSGCDIRSQYIPLKAVSLLPTPSPQEIRVVTGDLTGEAYEELGIILLRKYPGALEEEIVEKFREEARMRGADAVIKVEISRTPFFSIGPFFFSFPFPGIEAKGVAIRFKKGNS